MIRFKICPGAGSQAHPCRRGHRGLCQPGPGGFRWRHGGPLAVTINALRLAGVRGRRVKLRRLPESLVACRQGAGHALRMSSRTHIVLAAPVGRLTRMSMLVLGVLSVPSVGPAAMQRPPWAQHDPSAVHQGAHSGTHQVRASIDSASWDNGTQHECPHCPATECARSRAVHSLFECRSIGSISNSS